MNGLSFEMQWKYPDRSSEIKPVQKKEDIARQRTIEASGYSDSPPVYEDLWKLWRAKSYLPIGYPMLIIRSHSASLPHEVVPPPHRIVHFDGFLAFGCGRGLKTALIE